MGGTGLSGLAFSEGGDSFPGAYRDVFYIANPITGKIQAIRCLRGPDQLKTYANGWRLEHLPDFVQCGDPWFRPVAMAFGPDGCLYIVDWYNKIISHNEVPRNHPERDKTRGRIWRVRHESQPFRTNVPDLYKASDRELLAHLQATNTWEVNAVWQEIVDRQAISLAPELAKLVMNDSRPNDLRIRALWGLEGLGQVETKQLEKLATAPHRALRKEALRVARVSAGQAFPLKLDSALTLAKRGVADADRLVREEAIAGLSACCSMLPRIRRRQADPGFNLTSARSKLISSGARWSGVRTSSRPGSARMRPRRSKRGRWAA
jgi:hypothetical protein